MLDSPNHTPSPTSGAIQRCGYCGKVNDETASYCHGCGTPFPLPSDQAPTPSEQGPSLNARSATIILILYLVGQAAGAILAATAFATTHWPSDADIQSPKKVAAFKNKIMAPAMTGALLGGGLAMLLLSLHMVRPDLKDTSPVGAAWALGTRRQIAEGCAVGLLVAIGFLILARVPALRPAHMTLGPMSRMAMSPGLPQFLFFITAILLAPSIEELLFRGVLYGAYRRSFGPVTAAVLTTLIFCAMHLTEIITFPLAALGITGMALAAIWLRLRSGAVGPAIAAHLTYNAALSFLVFGATHIHP